MSEHTTTSTTAEPKLYPVPGTHGRYVADIAAGMLYSNLPRSVSGPTFGPARRMGSPETFQNRYLRTTLLSFEMGQLPTDEWLLRQPRSDRLATAGSSQGPMAMYQVSTAEAIYRAAGKPIPEGHTVGFKNDDTLDDRIDNLFLIRLSEVKEDKASRTTPEQRARILKELADYPTLSIGQIAERLRMRSGQVSRVRLQERDRVARALAAGEPVVATAPAAAVPAVVAPAPATNGNHAAPAAKTKTKKAPKPAPTTLTAAPDSMLHALLRQAAEGNASGPVRTYGDGEVYVLKHGDHKIVAESLEELASEVFDILVG